MYTYIYNVYIYIYIYIYNTYIIYIYIFFCNLYVYVIIEIRKQTRTCHFSYKVAEGVDSQWWKMDQGVCTVAKGGNLGFEWY